MAGKKILVIDDEPDLVTFLQAFLEDQGYDTSSASDGRSGLVALKAEAFDLVVMDLNMPNETGLQLYRTMQLDPRLKQMPVIFLTGMNDFGLFGEDCEPLPEPAERLAKPVDLGELHSAIARVLD